MADQAGTLEQIAEGVGGAFAPLEDLLVPQYLSTLLVELGIDGPPDLTGDAAFMQKITDAVNALLQLPDVLETLATAADNGDDTALIEAVVELIKTIATLLTALDAVATDFTRATAGQPNAAALAAF